MRAKNIFETEINIINNEKLNETEGLCENKTEINNLNICKNEIYEKYENNKNSKINKNKNCEANKTEVISLASDNSCIKISLNNSLVNSVNNNYKISSDSTKIEESPQIENSENENKKQKENSKNFNFFNSVNRKLLESEVINQSGNNK